MFNEQALNWDPNTGVLKLSLIPQLHLRASENDIRRLFDTSRYNRLQPQLSEWQAALAELKLQQSSDPISFVVAKQLDGYWQIEVSSDHMELTAKLTVPYGGKPASFADLTKLLQEKKVVQGLSRQALKQLIATAKQGQPGSVHEAIIAHGKEPIDGKDGYLERLVKLANERSFTPKAKDKNRVDLRNLGDPKTVNVGDPLMLCHPPTKGTNGFNLFGNVLEAKPGEKAKMTPGEGTQVSDSNPNLLIAQLAGLAIEKPNGMAVDELLTLKSVDVSTGHINFKGAVNIAGDVAESMKIEAGGDVVIQGMVESCEIRSGGNITIAQGAIGRQREDQSLTCELTAQGDIHIKHGQFAKLDAQGDIVIDLHSSHCELISNQKVAIGDPQRKQGAMSGGSVIAKTGLTCVELGTKAGGETKVQLGVDYIEHKRQFEYCSQRHSELLDQIVELTRKKKAATSSEEGPSPQALNLVLEDLRKQLDKNTELKDYHQQVLDSFYDGIQVIVLKHLYPRVSVEIGQEHMLTRAETGPSTLEVVSGRVEITPLTNTPKL